MKNKRKKKEGKELQMYKLEMAQSHCGAADVESFGGIGAIAPWDLEKAQESIHFYIPTIS